MKNIFTNSSNADGTVQKCVSAVSNALLKPILAFDVNGGDNASVIKMVEKEMIVSLAVLLFFFL